MSPLAWRKCEADDQGLRSQCIERLAELKHRPAIIALDKRGLDYRPEELRHYRREGTRALRHIAAGTGLEHGDYRISYYTSQEQLAGEHVLEADGIRIRFYPRKTAILDAFVAFMLRDHRLSARSRLRL
ncbi:MAG: hypothetical protein ACK4Z8_14175 [Novosphingobium sp.]